MQAYKKIGIFAHVQFMFLNGTKVVAEVSMANVKLKNLYKTLRVKYNEPDNITDYRNIFSTCKDKQLNREIMDGDWIFSHKGISSTQLQTKVKEMYEEIYNMDKQKKVVAVTDPEQAEFLKKCGILVLVLPDLPQTIDLIYTKDYYIPPKRKHSCRTKQMYCSQNDAWIKARYIQKLLKL